jgi:hypothetical protein
MHLYLDRFLKFLALFFFRILLRQFLLFLTYIYILAIEKIIIKFVSDLSYFIIKF